MSNAVSLMPMLVFQPMQINSTGQAVPIPGGKLWSYEAGTNVPQALYADPLGATHLTNPVILNAAGQAQIYLSSAPYKFLLTDANDVVIFPYPIDNVAPDQAATTLRTDLASTSVGQGASLVGYLAPYTGAIATTQAQINNEFLSVFRFMTPAQIADVTAGTAVLDVTAALLAAHAASNSVFYPRGSYLVSWAESTAMVTFANTSKIRIIGDGATLIDARVYAADSVSAVFQLTTCTDVVIDGLGYQGVPIVNKSDPTTGIGYRGATFVNLSTNCKNVKVKADLKYIRYGVRAGDYTQPAKGYNDGLRIDLTTFECGYPVALYLSSGIDVDLLSESSHRTAYLAGVMHGNVRAYFKNQYIAPIQVLVTDATTNGLPYPNGISRGCSDLDIVAHDLGSTIWTANSFCAAISMSRGDAGTTFENLKFDVYVKSDDTTAAQLSAFALYNNFTPYQPSYPNEWSQEFYFKNITLIGTLDRSAQTVAENSSNGEIYIYAYSSGSNYAIMSGVDLKGFRYYPGSGAKTRGFYYVAPGLIGSSSIENCDFGTATPFNLNTNTTSLVSFRNTRLRGSSASISDSPFNSAASFTDCIIANPVYQPLTNKTFLNTKISGSSTGVTTKIVDSGVLSGASVTLTNAVPAGAVVVGVDAIVTTAITGASGFDLGTATTPTLYANYAGITLGTSVPPVKFSSATAPINYPTATNLIITPKVANFTGGTIRIAIHYIAFTALTL